MNIPSIKPNAVDLTKLPGHRQQGVVLVMGLVILVILTVIGFSSMRTTSTQQKSATNFDSKAISIQAAEYGLSEIGKMVSGGCNKNQLLGGTPPCNPKIYSETSQVPNNSKAFWAIKSNIEEPSSSQIEIEIVGISKDSNTGSVLSESSFKATFTKSDQSVAIFADDIRIDSNTTTINGAAQAISHFHIDKLNTNTVVNIAQLNIPQSLIDSGKLHVTNCSNCSTIPKKIIDASYPTAPSQPTAPTFPAETGGTVVSNCKTSTWMNNWGSNKYLICSGDAEITKDPPSPNISNFRLLVNGKLTIKSGLTFGGADNLLAAKGNNIIFDESGNKPINITTNLYSDKQITFNAQGNGTININGTVKASEDITISAEGSSSITLTGTFTSLNNIYITHKGSAAATNINGILSAKQNVEINLEDPGLQFTGTINSNNDVKISKTKTSTNTLNFNGTSTIQVTKKIDINSIAPINFTGSLTAGGTSGQMAITTPTFTLQSSGGTAGSGTGPIFQITNWQQLN